MGNRTLGQSLKLLVMIDFELAAQKAFESIEEAQVTSRIEGLTLEEARIIDDNLGNVDVFSTATTSIPVTTSLVLDPEKVPCDISGLMFKPRGLKRKNRVSMFDALSCNQRFSNKKEIVCSVKI
jgi:hypothetical protein